jgi:hypothetical protein
MRLRLLASFAGLAVLALAAPAAQAAPRAATIGPDALTASWDGATATGLNVTWFTDSVRKTGKCGSTQQDYCDDTLVHVTAGPGNVFADDASLKFRIADYAPALSDFDLRVYEADETGTPLGYAGSPTSETSESSPLGGDDPRNTSVGDFEYKTVTPVGADAYYLVRVVYFTVAQGTYKGTATLSANPGVPAPAPEPAVSVKKAAKKQRVAGGARRF